MAILVASGTPAAAQEAAASSTTGDRVIQTDLDAPDIAGTETPKPAPPTSGRARPESGEAVEGAPAKERPKPAATAETAEESPEETASESKEKPMVGPVSRPDPGKRVAAFWMMLPEKS
jgi:hypothetical protein